MKTPTYKICIIISESDVRRVFNGKKAAGPDQIPGRVLKSCANQLAQVLTTSSLQSLTRPRPIPRCRSILLQTVRHYPRAKEKYSIMHELLSASGPDISSDEMF